MIESLNRTERNDNRLYNNAIFMLDLREYLFRCKDNKKCRLRGNKLIREISIYRATLKAFKVENKLPNVIINLVGNYLF